MLWLVIGVVLLIIAIAGGTIVHPILFAIAILAILAFLAGRRAASEMVDRDADDGVRGLEGGHVPPVVNVHTHFQPASVLAIVGPYGIEMSRGRR